MAESLPSIQELDIISSEVNKNLLKTKTLPSSEGFDLTSPTTDKSLPSLHELDVISLPGDKKASIISQTTTDQKISPEYTGIGIDERFTIAGEEPSTWEKIAYGIDKQNMFFGNVGRVISAGWEAAFDPEREFKEVAVSNAANERAELYSRHEKFRSGKYDDDMEVLIAEMGTFLLDPYYIFMYMTPWGRAMTMRQSGFKAAAKVAGLSAGAISLDKLFDNLATTGEVHPESVATAGALAGILGPASMKAFQVIGKLLPGADKQKIAQVLGVIEGKTAEKLGVSPKAYKVLQKIAGDKEFLQLNKHIKLAEKNWVKIIAKEQDTFYNSVRKVDQKINKLKADLKHAKKKDIKFLYKDKYIKNVGEKIAQIEKSEALKKKVFDKAQTKLWKSQAEAAKKNIDLVAQRDVQFLEKLWKEKALYEKTAQVVLSASVRPLMGAAVGYGFGKLWGPDDANLNKWMLIGASFGATHKLVQASKILPGQSKSMLQRLLYRDATKIAFQKVRELTSTTTSSKLASIGGETEKIGLQLLETIDSSLAKFSAAQRSDNLRREWMMRASNIVRPYSQTEEALAISVIRGSKEKVSTRVQTLANKLEKELIAFRKLHNDAGIFSLDEVTGKLMTIRNYFPRVYNFDEIKKDPKKFEDTVIKIFKSLGRSEKSAKNAAARFAETLKNADDSVINREALNNLISGVGVSSRKKGVTELLKSNPLSEHITKRRILNGPYAKVEKILEQNGYLVNDVQLIFGNLYNRSMKSIAFAEKFGAKGQLLKPYIRNIVKKYKDTGRDDWQTLATKEINLVMRTIDGYFERYGTMHTGTSKSMAGILATISNLNMLDRVTIASLGDVVQPFTNSNNWLSFWRGALRTSLINKRETGLAKNLMLAEGNEIRGALLRTSGIAQSFDDATMAANTIGKLGFTRKLNEWGFKWMGLQWLTGFARRYSYNVGAVDSFISAQKLAKFVSSNGKNALNTSKGLRLVKDLNKYSMSVEDGLRLGVFNNFDDALKNKTATRILNQSGILASNRDALIPQVSNRLLFTQSRNPWIRLMGQFTSWAMAKSTQTNKILQRIESGEVRQLVKLLGALPVYGGIQMLRELAKYGEVKTDPAYNEDKWWSEALRLSGMAGILPELTIGRLTGPGSQMPWFIPFPAASVATDIGKIAQDTLKGDTDKAWNRFLKKVVPFPTWREWVMRLFRGAKKTRTYKLDNIDSSDITIKPRKFSRGGRVKFEHGDVAVNKTLPSSTEFDIVSTTETENPDKYIVGDKLNEKISFTEEEVIEPHVEEKSKLPKEEISEVEAYVPLIKSYEGHGDKIYDSKGNVIAYKNYRLGDEKHITSGYGFYNKSNRENDSVTVEQAEKDLRKNIKIKLEAAKKGIKNFESLSDNLKQHIVSSWYRGALSGSPLTRELINAGEFEKAADEFLNNAEYKAAVESKSGVAARMEAVAEALRNEAKK